MAGEAHTFDQCFDVTGLTSQGYSMRIFYTLSSSGAGTSLFQGGIKSSAGTGYAGWGFLNNTVRVRGHGGAKSIMIWPDSTAPGGAVVAGYILNSEEASTINGIERGTLPLSNTAAEKSSSGEGRERVPLAVDGPACIHSEVVAADTPEAQEIFSYPNLAALAETCTQEPTTRRRAAGGV